MTIARKKLGAGGEAIACEFLRGRGYKILETNYRNALGEIDIVAQDGDTLCFVEVKTRQDDSKGSPLEAVTSRKQQKLVQVAMSYLKSRNRFEARSRFDVVAIVQEPRRVDLVKNAFEAAD